MKAVIPCAKKKDSMFPLSESKPTSLMPVGPELLIENIVRKLEAVGVEEIYIVTNYREEMFEELELDVKLIHQEELSGTATAVKNCDFLEEEFLVVNGDVMISEEDLEKLREKYREKEKSTVLAAHESKPEKFGVLSITHDQVNSIIEKPEEAENTLVNSGIYILEPEIFDVIQKNEFASLTDAVSVLAERGDLYFEMIEDYWLDIGSPGKLMKADRIQREMIEETDLDEEARVSEKAEISGKAVIEKGAEVLPGTVIEGNCFIGENAVVGPNTVLRDSTVSEDCQLRNCEVDSSLVFEENIVDPYVYMENCILGEEGDFKSGSVIRESFIGARSFVECNNSIRGVKFVPDARTDLGELSK